MRAHPGKKKKKGFLRILLGTLSAAAALLLLLSSALFVVNRYVVWRGSTWIVSEAEAKKLRDVDCILVLGAGVYANRYPSKMLEDRLLEGIRLYRLGVSDRILMSGDNSEVHYNEVKVMKDYAVKSGVPSEHVFQDHAGFSTYESMYRARDVFAAGRIVVVTQPYHMYRALYVARQLGLEAYGVTAGPGTYRGQAYREAREMFARLKDFVYCLVKPLPTFLGEVIPVSGNGDSTN